jgi:hypothetical protein
MKISIVMSALDVLRQAGLGCLGCFSTFQNAGADLGQLCFCMLRAACREKIGTWWKEVQMLKMD